MPRTSSAAERRAATPDPEPDQAMSHLLIRMANDISRLRQEVERNRQEVKALSKTAGATPAVMEEPAAVARLFDAAGFTGYMAILLLAFAFAFLLDLVLPA